MKEKAKRQEEEETKEESRGDKGRKTGRQACTNIGVLVNSYKSRIQKAGAGQFQVQGQAREAI